MTCASFIHAIACLVTTRHRGNEDSHSRLNNKLGREKQTTSEPGPPARGPREGERERVEKRGKALLCLHESLGGTSGPLVAAARSEVRVSYHRNQSPLRHHRAASLCPTDRRQSQMVVGPVATERVSPWRASETTSHASGVFLVFSIQP